MKLAEEIMGTSPALRKARSSVEVGVAHIPARATPTKVAAGPTPPRACRHLFSP
jgi:hypothetical protein